MAEVYTKQYQVDYVVSIQGEAAKYLNDMAASVEKMQDPMMKLTRQVGTINRAVSALSDNKSLQALFNFKPIIDLDGVRRALNEVKSLSKATAEEITADFSAAFSKAADNAKKGGYIKSQSIKESLENQIKTYQNQLDQLDKTIGQDWKTLKRNKKGKLVYNISGKSHKAVHGNGEIWTTIQNLRRLDKELTKHLTPIEEATENTKQAVKAATETKNKVDKVKKNVAPSAEVKNIRDTAKAITTLKSALSDFNVKRTPYKITIDANIQPAVQKIQTLVESIGKVTALLPVTAGIPNNKNKSKKGNIISEKTGKITKVGADNAAVAKSAAKNIAKDAKKAVAQAAPLVQETLKDKEVAINAQVAINKEGAIAQLEALLTELQTLADTKAINIKANVTNSGSGASGNKAGGSTANSNAKGQTGNVIVEERAKNKEKYAKEARQERAQRGIARANQIELERLYARTAMPKEAIVAGSPIRRGLSVTGRASAARAAASPINWASRFYTLTGNTSFGARTPMMVDMAKGMGTMMAVGGAMSAVGSSLSQAVSYQNIMKTTQAILKNGTSDYTDKGFKNMENIVRNVGMETKFTAPQVASAAKFLAMAGYHTNEINDAIRPVADIALIGDTNLGETADKLTNVMTTFGIKPADMRDIADIMATTFTRSNVDMMMLAESAKYAGGIANLYGGSFKNNFADVMAMFGILGNAGIQASSAGTTLRMMYQNLMQPNKNQKAALKKYGIHTRDSKGMPLEMSNIIRQIKEKVPTEQLADAMGSMFRITAQPGAATLASHVDTLKELMDANRNAAGTGISSSIADEKKNTLQGLWAQVTSTFTEGIVKALENREGGWAGELLKLRDELAKPETVNILSKIVDLVETLASAIKFFASMYAKVYSIAPGLVKSWMMFQMIMTQLGTLFTPFIQIWKLIGNFGGLTGGGAGKAAAGGGAAAGAALLGNIVNTGSRYDDAAKAAILGKRNADLAYWEKRRASASKVVDAYFSRINSLPKTTMAGGVLGAAANPAMMALYATAYPYGKDRLATEMIANPVEVAALNKKWKPEIAAKHVQRASQMQRYTKLQYFDELRKLRRPEQLANEALLARYMAMDAYYTSRNGGYRPVSAAGAQVVARQQALAEMRERNGALALTRQKNRVITPELAARYNSMMGSRRTFAGAWKTNFTAGSAMGTFSLVTMVASLKSTALSLFSGLAKAIGMLLSPIGLAIAGLTALGFGIWKLWDNAKKRKEQTELAQQNNQWLKTNQSKIASNYIEASVGAGGFKPITFGYTKELEEDAAKQYSLSDNPIVQAILDGKTEKLSGDQFVSQYFAGRSYLPKYMQRLIGIRARYKNSTDFHKSNKGSVSDEWDRIKNADYRKFAVISQWANTAVSQDNVKKAMQDLQIALYNKDMRKAQAIVDAYKPTSNRQMADKEVKDIANISDADQYYEWQYAQYSALQDMFNNFVGPSQHYSYAMDLLKDYKGLKSKDRKDYDISKLGQQLVQAIPVAFNGTTAAISLDKMGKIDWVALANSVNNSIPLTVSQQQEILSNMYDAIYNDPNIKNCTSIIDLLQNYLPQIANARNPYDEGGRFQTWQEANAPADESNNEAANNTLPNYLMRQDDSLHLPTLSLKNINVPLWKNDFDRVFDPKKGYMESTAVYKDKYPERFPQSSSSVKDITVNKTTRKGTTGGGNSGTDQKDYASKYNRSAAKPTQIIIDIENLAKFDGTVISKDAGDKAIVNAIETKIAEAIAQLSAQILTTASGTISQGLG